MVAERVVLRRVEHLEQRRRRVALDAGRHLVDLVEHEHRVHRAGLLERLDDAAGNRSDIRAAVPAYFCLVAHAAERDAHELAVHGARDRLAERRLAHAGRPDEAEDRPLHVAFELPDGEVLDDAFLDLVEVVVVVVEHAPRFHRVEAVLGGDRPRQLQDPVEIRPDHLVFRRLAGHARQPFHLARGHRVDRLRQVGVVDARAQLGQLGALALAELLLDGLHLLPQEVLTLRVGHLLLRLRFDLALQLEQRHLARERGGHRLQLLDEVVLLEDRLLVRRPQVEQRGQHVDEAQRVVDGHDQPAQLLGQARGERQRLVDQLLDAPHVRVHFERLLEGLGHRRDLRPHRRAGARHRVEAHARQPFQDDVDARPGLGHLADDGRRCRSSAGPRARDPRCRCPAARAGSAGRLPSARLTVSIDTPRVTASGCSVSGKATVLRSGRTGSSVGSGGGVGVGHCRRASARRCSVYQRFDVRYERGRAPVLHRKARGSPGELSVPAVPAHQRILHPLAAPDQEGSAARRARTSGPAPCSTR